jgi:hypothetical protein
MVIVRLDVIVRHIARLSVGTEARTAKPVEPASLAGMQTAGGRYMMQPTLDGTSLIRATVNLKRRFERGPRNRTVVEAIVIEKGIEIEIEIEKLTNVEIDYATAITRCEGSLGTERGRGKRENAAAIRTRID